MALSVAGTIVTFGDSWVDGRCSTTENGVVRPDLYQRWSDVLAARLVKELPNAPRAVVNAGIAGNRIIRAEVTARQRCNGSHPVEASNLRRGHAVGFGNPGQHGADRAADTARHGAPERRELHRRLGGQAAG